MSRPTDRRPTDCIHAGERHLPAEFGVNTPIVSSSAFDYRGEGVRYPRYHNTLNHSVVAERIAALDGAEAGLVLASGMGAISAVFFSLMKPGEHAILLDGLYGGTMDLVHGLLEPLGFDFSIWDGEPASLPALIRDNTRLLHLESPTNPLMNVVDLRATADICREHQVISVIDSTFASPVCQQPIALGFDLVMHSATKYLGGHSDLLCGSLAGSRALIDAILPTVIRLGASLNGTELALLERSIKTLSVRVARQSANAHALADWLEQHPGVEAVHYPGLVSHPGHRVAQRQMQPYGGMLSFQLADDLDPDAFLDRLRLIRPAISLGGVESTIGQPALTSHAKLSPDDRARLGIDERLMRLSVGLEADGDLIADLEQALNA
ncbi:MAG: trans-sulfuration enzyme family protein [Wenzhouxiangella sp.]